VTKLSVNLNRVALLRNTRNIGIPDVLRAAEIVIQAGADGITVHPRPDQRHIRPADVYGLADLLSKHPELEFNIEGNPFPEFMNIVRRVRPHQCTLVPDSPEQATSDHGWNIQADSDRLKPIIEELKSWGCRVSLFMDPDIEQIIRAADVGADRIELYTEPYAAAFAAGKGDRVLPEYFRAAAAAQRVGLGINAGHDLNLHNLPKFVEIPSLDEVSIGHALIADALEVGLFQAVRAYLAILRIA
jgi:pyridoxine 5-phosphate synthase